MVSRTISSCLLAVAVAGCNALLGADFDGYEPAGAPADAVPPTTDGPTAPPAPAPGAAAGSTCGDGRADCNGDASDGCESNLKTSPQHCGACGQACAAGQVCSGGACAGSCAAGETTCGASCVHVESDEAHCGACGNACPAPANGAGVCIRGACDVACAGGTSKVGAQCVPTVCALPEVSNEGRPGRAQSTGGALEIVMTGEAGQVNLTTLMMPVTGDFEASVLAQLHTDRVGAAGFAVECMGGGSTWVHLYASTAAPTNGPAPTTLIARTPDFRSGPFARAQPAKLRVTSSGGALRVRVEQGGAVHLDRTSACTPTKIGLEAYISSDIDAGVAKGVFDDLVVEGICANDFGTVKTWQR